MTINQWTAVFYDKVSNPLGMLETFDSLEIIQEFNQLGRWKLRTNQTQDIWDLLNQNAFRVNIQRNSVNVMTGLIHRISGDDSAGASWIEISGADQLFYLSSRLVYPATAGNFDSSAWDIRMGAAETTVKEYVNANATTSAGMPARRWHNFTVGTYRGVGETVSGRGRFQNLLEFCAGLLVSSDYRMRVVDNVFEVYPIVDKTSTVYLTGGMLNIDKMYYQFDAPIANYVIGGGTGDLTARTFVIAADYASINKYGRIESFYDGKNDDIDETTPAELEKLTDQFGFEITPRLNDPEFSVYDDYWIGDRISVKVFDTKYEEVIRSGRITVNQTSGVENYEVKIQSLLAGSRNPYRNIATAQNRINKRVSTQERN